MTTITRERLLKIQQWRETYGTGSNVMLPAEEAEELARIALASLTAQPAPERDQVRREHAEWSDKTFGDVGPIGPLKHLSKEALEAAADPSDPLEWADMQFLLWDSQRRMGLSDEFITRAMIEKLAINKARQWPEPKDGEPRLHIKEQPVPVVPDDWVMVPKEPTCQMMAQGHFAMKGTDRGKFRRIYQAMITAAPALNKGGINAE
ncbi:TPA: DUF550 domain-containing protein [Salmonella enterica subsp. enterica serovar Javiana]|nr:DUF550 domain-containing protein [Salmonella enterica subsp. enterica serovar Javiana]